MHLMEYITSAAPSARAVHQREPDTEISRAISMQHSLWR